jgi:hypothetical protein
MDPSFFSDLGMPDWTDKGNDWLATIAFDIQSGWALAQTGSGYSGWMLVPNGGAGPIDWSLLGPPPPTIEQQRLLTLKAAGMMVEHDMGCIAVPGAGLLAGGTAFQLGQPVAGSKPFVTPGSSTGTSTASEALRDALPQKLPFRVPTPVGGPGTGTPLRIAATNKLGAAAGRYVPFVGAAVAVYSAYKMTKCLNEKP